MSEITSAMLFIGAEIGVVLLLLFTAAVILFLKRRASDKRYVAGFIADHKEQQVARREAIKSAMESEALLVGDDLDEFLDEMNKSEKEIYKRVLNMYLGFDRRCLPEIRNELSDINSNWLTTLQKSIQNSQQGQVDEEQVKELNDKIENLKAENDKIAAELAEAMETMEDIVKEYSLMYAGHENATMDKLSDDYSKLKEKADSYKD